MAILVGLWIGRVMGWDGIGGKGGGWRLGEELGERDSWSGRCQENTVRAVLHKVRSSFPPKPVLAWLNPF